jgi:hypothetical protein
MAVAAVNAQILGVCLGVKKGFTGDLVGESANKKRVTAFGSNSFFGAGLGSGSGFSGCRLRLKSTSSQRYVRRRGRREEQDGTGSLLRVVAEKVVGIDLGTTNSAVAAMEGGKPTIVTNAEGQRTTPSVVAYSKNGDRLVGQIAKRQSVVNPENTFFSVKRFIGRKMSEIDNESKQVSYHVIRDSNGNVKLDCPAIGKSFAAEEISAQVREIGFRNNFLLLEKFCILSMVYTCLHSAYPSTEDGFKMMIDVRGIALNSKRLIRVFVFLFCFYRCYGSWWKMPPSF